MKKQKKHSSGFLFSTPSFLSGAGTSINLAGNFYRFNSFDSAALADRVAIENDFQMISQDIFGVIERIKEKK